MTFGLAGLIFVTTLVTAFISGIFGMAGGIILIGVLTATLPVATAMILHGMIQLVSNGWRAWLIRDHISWPIIGRYLIGGIPAIAVLAFIMWRPEKHAVFFMLGVLAFIPWIPKRWFALDAAKPFQAEALGFIAQGLNTLAGVVGPVLDIFFVTTEMTRKEIVATKGATQVIAHLTKIMFWSLPVFLMADMSVLPPWWVVLLAIPISMVGTWLGGLVLDRMSDVNFKNYTKYVLTVIGVVYLLRAFSVL